MIDSILQWLRSPETLVSLWGALGGFVASETPRRKAEIMSKLTQRERAIASKYRRYLREKAKAKSLYDRADGTLEELSVLMREHSRLVEVKNKQGQSSFHLIAKIRKDGRELHLIDCAAGTGIVLGWASACVRRYEPKEIDP
jgi:hypothetical protein